MWQELTVIGSAAQAPAIEERMWAHQALSVTMKDAGDQPILEPASGETPLWESTTITALFEADTSVEALRDELISACQVPPEAIRRCQFADEQWTRKWMEDFQPVCFGKRLWVCPSWQRPPDAAAIPLLLDPGLAFGTGTHPTTSMVLEWLDYAMDERCHTIVDYGCGSGILAIAGLLLGARQALGIDNDPQALTASHENAAKNSLPEQRLQLYLPEEKPGSCQADILVANILATPLIELSPTLCSMLKPGGRIALSGILTEQAEQVMAAYQHTILFNHPQHRGGWVLLEGYRKA